MLHMLTEIGGVSSPLDHQALRLVIALSMSFPKLKTSPVSC
jgi:hypothetical protein